ncbi:MAG: universal stress protein [Bacteroidota bacterium]
MKRILVPTDFSEIALTAAMYAVSLAEITQSDVIIYHADQQNISDHLKLQKETAQAALNRPSVNVSYVASHKKFSSLNLEEAIKEHHIDMIIMGTSGQDAEFQETLFQRNATDIAEHVSCPVIVVPPEFVFSPIKHIAYASDLNFIDKEIYRVISLANMFNASLEIFHVSPVFPDLGDTEKINMKAKIDGIKSKAPNLHISYSAIKTEADNEITVGISEFLETHATDILVMYHHHLSAFDEFFNGSNTSQIIRHIKIPVLVYPKS